MEIALLLLALLFIVGLFSTFINIPAKKITAWCESFGFKAPSLVGTNPTTDQKKLRKSDDNMHNKAELKRVFASFDKNKDGFITNQELSESLNKIGMVMEEQDVADMVQNFDSNGDGLVDFEEFCELFDSMGRKEKVSGKNGEEEGDRENDLKEAFNVFDGDGDGLITVEELGLVLSSLGFMEGKGLEDCKEMISQVDEDGDGMVNLEEFKRMMKDGERLIPIS